MVFRAPLASFLVVLGAANAAATPGLTKEQVKPAIKQVVPKLGRCYAAAQRRAPSIAGVVNIKLAIESTRTVTRMKVTGFDTSGALGTSKAFRACVTKAFAAAQLPSSGEGRLEMVYPMTFAPEPPDNRDTALADQAKQAAAAGRWRDAFDSAERVLESTSVDGTIRRPMIELAGVAACHLGLAEKARHYATLAASRSEQVIRDTCKRVARSEAP
jgi:hypothetical protein